MIKKFYIPQEEKTHDLSDTGGGLEFKTVLILEDEDILVATLTECLEANSFKVTAVKNGVEGLQKIQATDFDVILCDMVMPTFPGDMFFRAVERIKPHLCKRFLFMTGHKGEPKIDAFIRQVRGVMLWKPFQIHQLLEAIQLVVTKTQKTAT